MKVLRLGQSLCSSNGAGDSFKNLYSLDFDGVDDYLLIPDANVLSINNSGANRGFSISFWLKRTAASGGEILINKGSFFSAGAYHFEYVVTTNYLHRMKFIVYGNDNSSIFQQIILDQSIAFETWTHIGLTFDLGSTSGSLKGYINGVYNSGAAYASGGTWAAAVNTVSPLEFSKASSNYGESKLDEVAIFDDELSLAQMQDIYNSGTPTDLSNESYLVGYWRNGDPTGTGAYPTITDQSSNSNDGVMTNMVAGDIVSDAP